MLQVAGRDLWHPEGTGSENRSTQPGHTHLGEQHRPRGMWECPTGARQRLGGASRGRCDCAPRPHCSLHPAPPPLDPPARPLREAFAQCRSLGFLRAGCLDGTEGEGEKQREAVAGSKQVCDGAGRQGCERSQKGLGDRAEGWSQVQAESLPALLRDSHSLNPHFWELRLIQKM